MITVKAYLYPNTVTVQVFDPAIFTVRNRVVYSRTIKVYQGIDNPRSEEHTSELQSH